MGSDPLSPSGSSHENSLFRCFAHGLKLCMSWALDIVKLFSLSLFYELVIQLQVDICILDTILMLPEFGPESGAVATVGEFVLCVTMTWRHLHFKWRNGLQKQQQQWIDSKWKLRKSLPHVLSDVLSNEEFVTESVLSQKRLQYWCDSFHVLWSVEMEMKSLSERFPFGKKSQQIF